MKKVILWTILIILFFAGSILLAHAFGALASVKPDRSVLPFAPSFSQAHRAAPPAPPWVRAYQSHYPGDRYDGHEGYGIQPTDDGGAVVVGIADVGGTASLEGSDAVVMKLSPSGAPDWSVAYDHKANDNYDLGKSLARTSDGGYLVVGSEGNTRGDVIRGDLLAMKLSADGEVDWIRACGGPYNDHASNVQSTPDGGFIIVGDTEKENPVYGKDTDAWVLKLSSSGSIVWQTAIGGSADELLNSVQSLPGGDYLAVGTIYNPGVRTSQAWAVRLGPSGAVKWQKTYGDAASNWDEARSVLITRNGDFLVAGSKGSLDSRAGLTGSKIWVWELNDSGDILWQRGFQQENIDRGTVVVPSPGRIDSFAVMGSGTNDINSWSWQGYALGLSSTGSLLWQWVFGSGGDDAVSIEGAHPADDGRLWMTGIKGGSALVMNFSLSWINVPPLHACPFISPASFTISIPAAQSQSVDLPARATSAQWHDLTYPPNTSTLVETVCEITPPNTQQARGR